MYHIWDFFRGNKKTHSRQQPPRNPSRSLSVGEIFVQKIVSDIFHAPFLKAAFYFLGEVRDTGIRLDAHEQK